MRYTYGPSTQRGRGLGSFLAGLARGLIPVARMGANAVARVATSKPMRKIAKTAATTAMEIATDVAADAIEGRDIKKNLSKNMARAKKDVSQMIRSRVKRRKYDKIPPRKTKKRRGKTYNLLNDDDSQSD